MRFFPRGSNFFTRSISEGFIYISTENDEHVYLATRVNPACQKSCCQKFWFQVGTSMEQELLVTFSFSPFQMTGKKIPGEHTFPLRFGWVTSLVLALSGNPCK